MIVKNYDPIGTRVESGHGWSRHAKIGTCSEFREMNFSSLVLVEKKWNKKWSVFSSDVSEQNNLDSQTI